MASYTKYAIAYHWIDLKYPMCLRMSRAMPFKETRILFNFHMILIETFDKSVPLKIGHMISQAIVGPSGFIDGLVGDCSISIASALKISQSCTRPVIWA